MSASRTAAHRWRDPLQRALRGARAHPRALAASAALALAALYASGPYWTLHALRAALREGDAAELVRRLDLERAQASVQAQLEPMLAQAAAVAPTPGTPQAVFGWVGPAIAQPLAPTLLAWVFTPAGIAEFARREGEPLRELLAMAVAPPPADRADASDPRAALHPDTWLDAVEAQGFCGPARFCVSVGSGWSFELAPLGLRWRVVQIGLPPGLLERRAS
jgi:hypothetical protein